MQPNVRARVLLSPSNPGLQDPEIAMIEGCDDVCSYRMFGTSKHTDSYMRNNNLHGRLRIAKFAILVAGSPVSTLLLYLHPKKTIWGPAP